MQPLAGEIFDEGAGSRVGEEPVHLSREILSQFTAIGQCEQLIIRHRRPEEVGEAHRERVFIDGAVRVFRVLGYGLLDAKQEAWRRKHGDHGGRDALFKTLVRLSVDIFGQFCQSVERSLIGRSPECLLRKSGQHFAGVIAQLIRIFWIFGL